MEIQPCSYDYKWPVNFFSNNPKENALFRAIAENSLERVRKEIDSGIYIDCRTTIDLDWTPLLMAFSLNRKEIFHFLLECGANTEATLNDGRSLGSLRTEANFELYQA